MCFVPKNYIIIGICVCERVRWRIYYALWLSVTCDVIETLIIWFHRPQLPLTDVAFPTFSALCLSISNTNNTIGIASLQILTTDFVWYLWSSPFKIEKAWFFECFTFKVCSKLLILSWIKIISYNNF